MRRIIVILILVLMAATVGAVSAQSGQRVHVVGPGETLSGIAYWYGVDVSALANANGLSDFSWVYVGQWLVIPYGSTIPAPFYPVAPTPTPAPQVYTVRPGDTLASIAAAYGSTPGAIVMANGIANANRIVVGQSLTIPAASQVSPSSYSYTVTYGDTLASIASRYGTTVAAIAGANGISNPGLIHVGLLLRIPA